MSTVKVLLMLKIDTEKTTKNLILNIESFLYSSPVVSSQFSCYPTSQHYETGLSIPHPLITLPSCGFWHTVPLGFLLPPWLFLPSLFASTSFSPCSLSGGVSRSFVFRHFLSSICAHSLGELISFVNNRTLWIYQWLQSLHAVQTSLLNSRHTHPTAYWTFPFGCQTDISKSPFQAEFLISSHSATHGFFHLSWWQLHPLGELLMPQTLESSPFLSFVLHIQCIQIFYWFYLPNISPVFSLPITSPWPPWSEPPSSLPLLTAVGSLSASLLLPLLPCSQLSTE